MSKSKELKLVTFFRSNFSVPFHKKFKRNSPLRKFHNSNIVLRKVISPELKWRKLYVVHENSRVVKMYAYVCVCVCVTDSFVLNYSA